MSDYDSMSLADLEAERARLLSQRDQIATAAAPQAAPVDYDDTDISQLEQERDRLLQQRKHYEAMAPKPVPEQSPLQTRGWLADPADPTTMPPVELGPPSPTPLQGFVEQYVSPLAGDALEWGNRVGGELGFIQDNPQFTDIGTPNDFGFGLLGTAAPAVEGAIAGGLKGADALANLIMRAPTAGLVPMPAINTEALFESIPSVQEAQTLAPTLYGGAKTVGEFTSPIPALGNLFGLLSKAVPTGAKGAGLLERLAGGVSENKFLPSVANESLQGGIINSGLVAGQQIKENRFDPMEIAGAGALGVGAGGALSGGLRGLLQGVPAGLNVARQGINAGLRKVMAPKEADKAATAAAARLRAGEAAPPEPPKPPPQSDWDYALSAVKNAQSDDEMFEAIREANKLKKEQLSGLEGSKHHKQLKKKLEQDLRSAEDFRAGQKINVPAANTAPMARMRLSDVNAGAAVGTPQNPLKATIETNVQAPAAPPAPPKPPELTPIEIELQKFPMASEPLKSDRRVNHSGGAVYARDYSDADVQQWIDDLNTELSRSSNANKDNAKTRELKRQLGTFNDEKMRREYRKQQGLRQDWPADDPRGTIENIRQELAKPEPPRPVDQNLIDELTKDMEPPKSTETLLPESKPAESKPPEPPPAEPLKGTVSETAPVSEVGEFRHIAQNYGRDKVFAEDTKWHPNDHPLTPGEAVQRGYISEDVTPTLQTAADAKLDMDEAEYVFENAAEQFYHKFKDHPDVETSSKKTSGNKKARVQMSEQVKLSTTSENIYNVHRFNVATGVVPGQSAHLRGLSEHKFGSDRKSLPTETIQVSDDLDEAIKQLHDLKERFKETDTNYDSIRKDLEDHITTAEQRHIEATGDPVAKFHLNVESSRTDRTGKPVRVQLEHKKQAFELHLEKTVQEEVDAIRAEMKEYDELAGTARKETKFSFLKYKAVSGGAAALGSLLAGTKAQAAELTQAAVQHANATWLDVAHNPAAQAGVAATLVAAVGRPIAQKIVNSKSWVAQVLYTNTMDHVRYIDKYLADIDKAAGKTPGKSLHESIHVDAMGQAHAASFGVHFEDQVLRQSALNRLRDNSISPLQVKAMTGPAVPMPKNVKEPTAKQVFESLNPDQRWAVLKQHEGMLKIKKAVEAKIARLDAHVEQLKKRANKGDQAAAKQLQELQNDARFTLGEAALQTVLEGVSPGRRRSVGAFVDSKFSNWVGAYYDGLFALNTAHHLTNTTDMMTAGLAATGPINMGKANAALAFNPTVKKHFKSSNLIGSFAADITDLKASKNATNKGLEDFQSDKFNADRVALASWYQFFNRKDNADIVKKLGISEDQFIKEMLEGNPATMSEEKKQLITEAWGHMAETLSDTLGADIFHLNKASLANAAKASTLGVFINQPARVARMMMKYMAEGNFTGMISFIGMTAAISGSSAIPLSARSAWGLIDPEGMNQTANMLDENSLSGRLGRPMSKKMEWDYLWPVFAAALPLGEDLKKATHESGAKVAHALIEYFGERATNPKKAETLLPDLAKVFATAGTAISVALAQSRLPGGVPVRFGTKTLRGAAYAAEGKKPVYEDTVLDGNRNHPKTLKFKELKVDPNEQHANQFLPGMDMWEYQNSKYQREVNAILQQAAAVQSMEKATRGTPLNPFFKDLVSHQKQTKPAYSAKYDKPNRSPFHLLEGIYGDQRKDN